MIDLGRYKTDQSLLDLIRETCEAFEKLPEDQKQEHFRLQRESWVRGEMGIGSDQDEAEYRRKMMEERDGYE